MNDANKRYLDFCRPFIDGIKEVYNTMMDIELQAASPVFKEEPIAYGDVTSLMGISGVYEKGTQKRPFKGNMVISWPMDTYIKTASAMMMEEYTEMCEDIADVGMEIANITTGHAKKNLNPEGYLIDMATPTSVEGKNLQLRTGSKTRTVLITFESKLGTFFVELNYEDS